MDAESSIAVQPCVHVVLLCFYLVVRFRAALNLVSDRPYSWGVLLSLL